MPVRKLSLPCSCAGSCTILFVIEFDSFEDEPGDWWVDFYTKPGSPDLVWRLKQIWKVITNNEDAYAHSVNLAKEQLAELKEFLDSSPLIND